VILLTGSSGTIGRKVSSDLKLDVRFPFQGQKQNLPIHTFENSTLVHLAGMSNPKLVALEIDKSYSVNVLSAVELFRIFAENKGRRFVFASSGHVYGNTQWGVLSKESDVINPHSRYAEQKAKAETFLRELALEYETELLILRIFSVFGSGMRENYLAGMIEKSLNDSGNFPLIANSDDVRDFSSPAMIADYLNRSIDLRMEPILTLNICSGVPSSVRDKVVSAYPSIPRDKLLDGNSEIPYLVGNPELMNKYFNAN
jgi:nucleoside-diphosphate-sugar epimerase